MIRAKVDGRWRRHIPDYLLIRGAELTFVAVKHWERLNDPKVVEMITWVREVVESGGWAFEVYSALPRPFSTTCVFLRVIGGRSRFHAKLWMRYGRCD